MNESRIRLSQREVVSSSKRETALGGTTPLAGASQVGQIGIPLREQLKMDGKTSHVANAATRFEKPGRPCSHSNTVMLGLGIFLLLSIRGSAWFFETSGRVGHM